MSLRSKYVDSIFGNLKKIEFNQLPTNADVIKNVLFDQRDKKDKRTSNRPIFKQTFQRVKDVWIKTGIPIISDKSIERRCLRLYDEYKAVIKYKSRPHEFKNKAIQFRETMENTLFDISSCQCETQCKCPYGSKVPLQEKDFLSDQRSVRKMFLGSFDARATRNAKIQVKRNGREKKGPSITKKKVTTAVDSFDSNITYRANSYASAKTKYKKLTNVYR